MFDKLFLDQHTFIGRLGELCTFKENFDLIELGGILEFPEVLGLLS